MNYMDILHNKNGQFKKGNKGFWLGKKRPNISGKNNPRWGGGEITKICMVCGKEYRVRRYMDKSKFCSHNCRAKFYFSKERNCNWKGGVSEGKDRFKNSPYYKNWRNKVFRRDKWICRLCGHRSKESKAHGNKESDIHAHHIIPMEINMKLCLKVGNGITLCKKCHRLTYGKELNFVKVFKEILRDFMSNIPKG